MHLSKILAPKLLKKLVLVFMMTMMVLAIAWKMLLARTSLLLEKNEVVN